MEEGSGVTKNKKITGQALTTGSVNLMSSRFAYLTDFVLKDPSTSLPNFVIIGAKSEMMFEIHTDEDGWRISW